MLAMVEGVRVGADTGRGATEEDERDDDEDDQEEGGDDEKAFDEEEFIYPSLSTHAEKETRDEESFDPILKTPKNSDDEGNGEENLGTNVGREEGNDEEEEEDELYRDVNLKDERNDEDDQEEGCDDEQASDEEEFIHPSLSTHAKEKTRDEENFDHILKTLENTDDEGNGDENLGINVGREEGQDEEYEEDELYKDVNVNLGRGIQMGDVHQTQEFEDSYMTLTPINPDGQQQSSSVSS
nr:hypothetical protein [Tanacetum cinerariifolium]